MKSNLQVKTIEVEISGTSKTGRNDAVNNAFRQLQQKIRDTVQDPIIYMKPVDVEVISFKEKEFTEKYLGIFMLRKRNNCSITLRVVAEVSVLKF